MKKKDYIGLAQTTTKATRTVLTLGMIEKAIKHEKSKKCWKQWIDSERARISFYNEFYTRKKSGV